MASVTLEDKDEALVKRVRDAFESAEDLHKAHRDKWSRFYAKYRSYKDVKRTHEESEGRDVASILRDAAGPFGTDLFIPYAFSTIETIAPRMLAGNPELLIEPAQPEYEDNVENIRLVIDRQQDKINYPLILQDVAKNGLIYGIGWQKTYWHEAPLLDKKVLERGITGRWVVGSQKRRGYQGPMAEAIDPFDLIHDPDAQDVESSRWIIHRSWPTNAEVKKNVEEGTWKLPKGVELDDLLEGGTDSGRDEIFADRMRAQGIRNPDRRGDRAHCLWEFHDALAGEVISILDQWVPVQHGVNPFWHGELPFQCFRPTRVPGEMCGIGEIEAIEDLIDEMNIMRSQRRDNAAVVLQRPYFYFDGLLDPKDFVFGPGKAIPVEGDPRNVIFPAPLSDIPNSSYQEDAGLQRDIERTLGIDDSTAGASAGGSDTATGAQLVTAAAGVRIQSKTRRCELETVKPTARQFLELNQQYIIEESVIPGPPTPGDMHHRAFSWYKIGPAELAGEYEVKPKGGSMSPQAKIERQQKAQAMMVAFANNPLVDQRTLFAYVLKEGFEIENPEGTGWLAPEEPDIPIEAMELVAGTLGEAYGVDPGQFMGLVMEAVAQVDQQKMGQEGPGVEGAPAPGEAALAGAGGPPPGE